MKLVIFDFETFKHDTLLGALEIDEDHNIEPVQSWNLDDIKCFYRKNIDSIWIGHNNKRYDNFILQAVVQGKTSEQIRAINDMIIREDKKLKLTIELKYYDLILSHQCALKQMEAYDGKNISETEVDFMLDRHLTDEEKRLVESYNIDDLDQTFDDFVRLKHEFTLRLDIIKTFDLDMSNLHATGTQIAENVLHAQKLDNAEKLVKKPVMWPTLRVKNQAVIDFYLGESWSWRNQNKGTLDVELCGCMHRLASGGIHAAKLKTHVDWAYYFDVSGYYNLIMIILDLLPRSIPQKYRELYTWMYHEQLRLKKIDPGKRGVYKTILLSVFGAMNNEFCRFYDPYNGDLVRMSGQMYLVDLLEKCEGKLEIIQSNTDGIILTPINGTTEEEVMAIMNEWTDRTGFVLKLDKVYDLQQRDVNCYMYRDADGEIHVVGGMITHYGKQDYPFWKNSYSAKEPLILADIIVEYYMNGKLPEQVVEEKKHDLRLFQTIAKKQSFDWMQFEETHIPSGETSMEVLQNVNRVFARKPGEYESMVYKMKHDGKRAKLASVAPSVFVYNDEILSEKAYNDVISKLDLNYYIDRGYDLIASFQDIEQIKGVKI